MCEHDNRILFTMSALTVNNLSEIRALSYSMFWIEADVKLYMILTSQIHFSQRLKSNNNEIQKPSIKNTMQLDEHNKK